MQGLYKQLEKDVRFKEGMKACMNCGVCTAICPAAEVSDYDPRMVMNIVQERDEQELEKLLKSDTIWRCGECLSCKTRCPRGNVPCSYEEIAGLLLGHDPWDIGLQSHQVSVEPLLDKLGISYNPEMKYKGPDGEDIGSPEHPEVLKCY